VASKGRQTSQDSGTRTIDRSTLLIISDGKMLFEQKEIVERENRLLCCYEMCHFELDKTESTEKDRDLMLEHISSSHFGKNYSKLVAGHFCHLFSNMYPTTLDV
jgi:hypothetical protein